MGILKNVKKMRKNKKGFTLVELIVVLVILAILLAILVPSLMGWIDKAKDKQILAEARSVQLAAQGIASEYYGENDVDLDAVKTYLNTEATGNKEIKGLAEITNSNATITINTINAQGKITELTYVSGTGKTATLTVAKGWEITPTS